MLIMSCWEQPQWKKRIRVMLKQKDFSGSIHEFKGMDVEFCKIY